MSKMELKELYEIEKELDDMYGIVDEDVLYNEEDTPKYRGGETTLIKNRIKGIKRCPCCNSKQISEVFMGIPGYLKNEYWCLNCGKHFAIKSNAYKKIITFSYDEEGVMINKKEVKLKKADREEILSAV